MAFLVKSKIGYEIDNWLRHNPDQKGQYAVMSRKEKQAFRTTWASHEVQVADQQLVTSESLEHEDEEKGIMLPPKRISVELGNDDNAALRYCMSCLKMGPTEWMIDVICGPCVRSNGVIDFILNFGPPKYFLV